MPRQNAATSPATRDLPRMPRSLGAFRRRHRRLMRSYVQELANLMGLPHWAITIRFEERSSSDAHAEVSRTDGALRAELWLEEKFTALPRSRQRQVIVHELMHLHTADLQGLLDAARKQMERSEGRLWKTVTSAAEELLVDSVAEAWSSSLPMPPWR